MDRIFRRRLRTAPRLLTAYLIWGNRWRTGSRLRLLAAALLAWFVIASAYLQANRGSAPALHSCGLLLDGRLAREWQRIDIDELRTSNRGFDTALAESISG